MKYKVNVLATHLLFILVFVFNAGCSKASKEQSIQVALEAARDRFPEILQSREQPANKYTLVRTVVNAEKGFELHLYTGFGKKADQQLVVFVNSASESYAVPFPDNTYRAYWAFQFDELVTGEASINSKFAKELKTALDTLQLNGSPSTTGAVMKELFVALLHAKSVTNADSAALHTVDLRSTSTDASVESIDSCLKRQHANYNMLMEATHPGPNVTHLNAYLDNKNSRIYQVILPASKESELVTKVFLRSCNIQAVSL